MGGVYITPPAELGSHTMVSKVRSLPAKAFKARQDQTQTDAKLEMQPLASRVVPPFSLPNLFDSDEVALSRLCDSCSGPGCGGCFFLAPRAIDSHVNSLRHQILDFCTCPVLCAKSHTYHTASLAMQQHENRCWVHDTNTLTWPCARLQLN